jgi:hypothetical protein
MTFICEFCKNSYKTKSSLKNHQKTTIKCLDIQKKLGLNLEVKSFFCDFCNKNLTSKKNLENHFSICQKKIDNDNDNKNKLYYENKIKKLEEEIENKYENKIKELERIIIEKNIIISKLEGSIDVYKEDHQAFVDIAKQPKNNTTNNNNKVLNIKSSFDFEDKMLLENALSNYNLEYFLDGQKGIAHFVADTILRDEENNFKYICTDIGRSIFKYKDNLGNIKKDYKAQKLTNYLVEGGIKDRVHDISEKWISKDEKVNKNKLELAMEKNNEVNEIDKNNNIFKQELASMVVI